MVCTWLIDSDQFESAQVRSLCFLQARVIKLVRYFLTRLLLYLFLFTYQDSLEYFGERRTDKSQSSKFQGVETPSQVRLFPYKLSPFVLFKNFFLF